MTESQKQTKMTISDQSSLVFKLSDSQEEVWLEEFKECQFTETSLYFLCKVCTVIYEEDRMTKQGKSHVRLARRDDSWSSHPCVIL